MSIQTHLHEKINQNQGRLFIVDQSLDHPTHGHHAEYNFSIYDSAEARGLNPTIIASNDWKESREQRRVYPAFTQKWAFESTRSKRLPKRTNASDSVDSLFQRDLQLALSRHAITSYDRIFIHTMAFTEIEDITQILASRSDAEIPEFHLLFRRDLDESDAANESPVYCRFIQALKLLSLLDLVRRKVFFYTDTEELTAQYSKASALPFKTLPVPFDTEALEHAMAGASVDPEGPITIAYFGDARPEKGYQHLPRTLKALYPLAKQGKLRFVLQSNFNLPGGEPGIAEARDLLARFPRDYVELLMDPLPKEGYYEQLSASDIILIPYEASRYKARSSGIFAQALAAGKIPVVPAGTWMANELARLGFKHVYVFGEDKDLVESIRAAIIDFDMAQKEYSAAALAYRANCCPASLLALLDKPRSSDTDRRPTVLHMIDGDAYYYKGGTAVTQNNQRRYLQAIGARIFTVFIVRSPLRDDQIDWWEKIIYRFCVEQGLGFAWLSYLRTYDEADSMSLKGHFRRCSSLTVPALLDAAIRMHPLDFILHNYIETLPLIKQLNPDQSIPIITEIHDIQSYQLALARKESVDTKELAFEMDSLAAVNALVSVNDTETINLKNARPSLNIRTIEPRSFADALTIRDIAGPQDLAELLNTTDSELGFVQFDRSVNTEDNWQIEKLLAEKSIDLLFVSSWHIPNALSLTWFFEEVFLKYLYPENFNLFLAGTISDTPMAHTLKERCPKVYLSGKVQNLRPLYAAAKVVLLPIVAGAGINIKAIESIAFAKPFVATSQCLGDISLDPGVINTFDSPRAYADEVLRLLGSRHARSDMHQALKSQSDKYSDISAYCKEWNTVVIDAVPGIEKYYPLTNFTANTVQRPFIEWTEQIGDLNRFLRSLLNNEYVDERVANSLTVGHITDQDFPKYYLQILDELAIKQTAPILELQAGAIKVDISWCKPFSAASLLRILFLRYMQNTGTQLEQSLAKFTGGFRSKQKGKIRQPEPIPTVLLFANIGPSRRYKALNEVMGSTVSNFVNSIAPLGLSKKGISIAVYIGANTEHHFKGGVEVIANPDELSDLLASSERDILVYAPDIPKLILQPDLFTLYQRIHENQIPLVGGSYSLWFLDEKYRISSTSPSDIASGIVRKFEAE